MKKMRTRLLSLLLVLVTVLSLLPTSALAASSTGTGIKPTSNTNYWTTRLLHDGTPYSYKPPMAAGKMLYCMDRGYGYRWGTPSFLNSYTYTSATGADADAVLKTALAQSGMGELDAQQLENFKWMMTFISDYKGDIPGSLFTHIATVPRMKGERIIWISESNSFGEINLPRHHFFAVRQEDGTHRFFGSNEPGKI